MISNLTNTDINALPELGSMTLGHSGFVVCIGFLIYDLQIKNIYMFQ